MTKVHDMGGRYGDGPVVPEDEAVKFKEDWHRQAMALTVLSGAAGYWNLDMSRHAREALGPEHYPQFSYYEKWIAALADILVSTGALTRGELTSGQATPLDPPRLLKAADLAGVLAKGGPADRPSDIAPAFAAGDVVRTRAQAQSTLEPGGHTRLPSYAAGCTGKVVRYHGAHVLPDSNAHGHGEAPEPLYAVAIPARELWDNPEHPEDEVVLDLWQSYLEPA